MRCAIPYCKYLKTDYPDYRSLEELDMKVSSESKAKVARKPRRTEAVERQTPRKFYHGRPIYTEEDRADPNFVFPYPPEPEWEAEWNRLHRPKNRKKA